MTEFKPGDRVKVLTPGLAGNGTVERLELYTNIVFVKHDTKETIGFTRSELELIVEKAFAPGEHVEYSLRGVVKNVYSDGFMQLRLGNQDWTLGPEDYKDLTKITPPFPTKLGSVIKAKHAGAEKLFSRVKDAGGFVWYSFTDDDHYLEQSLELISIEYTPGD